MSDYAPRIRAARAYAGLSQEQLAEKLGVDAQTVKRRESGTQEPKRQERIAISQITGVPLDFLEHGFAGAWAPSEEQIRATAELLGPQLLEAVQALAPSSGRSPRVSGEPDRRGEGSGGGDG